MPARSSSTPASTAASAPVRSSFASRERSVGARRLRCERILLKDHERQTAAVVGAYGTSTTQPCAARCSRSAWARADSASGSTVVGSADAFARAVLEKLRRHSMPASTRRRPKRSPRVDRFASKWMRTRREGRYSRTRSPTAATIRAYWWPGQYTCRQLGQRKNRSWMPKTAGGTSSRSAVLSIGSTGTLQKVQRDMSWLRRMTRPNALTTSRTCSAVSVACT
jgi:hypothetical protein